MLFSAFHEFAARVATPTTIEDERDLTERCLLSLKEPCNAILFVFNSRISSNCSDAVQSAIDFFFWDESKMKGVSAKHLSTNPY